MPRSPNEFSFQVEALRTLLGQGLEDLAAENHAEIEPNPLNFALLVDWEWRLKLEAIGSYAAIAARYDGQLVGYDAFFLNPHPHSKDAKVAYGDVLYLMPEFRGGMVGVSQIKTSEKILKGLGCVQVDRGVQEHFRIGKRRAILGDLLERLGYSCTERRYTKAL